MGQWEGVRHASFPEVKAGVIERLALHCNRVPRDVELGVHLCYGSYGGRHWKEPESTPKKVGIHKPPILSLRPPPSYIYMPGPPYPGDKAYFVPPREMKLHHPAKP